MELYNFVWDTNVTRCVGIEANSKEEAYEKWIGGEYGKTDVDDEDMSDDIVEIDGEAYSNERFEKISFGGQDQC
ncbi:hypothetical protein ATZ33_17310 [Enterococcus silesiacus]|uniref:Uncharacterized protein n=1 Tax=Enterococcus silesiacus TaxID=332949 RepID=A0ABM5WDH3_9ENTE|nr:hypothetical protein ATZ33_17310 [Enterococcus silesiacus]